MAIDNHDNIPAKIAAPVHVFITKGSPLGFFFSLRINIRKTPINRTIIIATANNATENAVLNIPILLS